MALELVSFVVTVDMLGEANSRRRKSFEIALDGAAADDAGAFASALNTANQLVTQLAGLTEAVIVGWTMSGQYEEQTTVTTPADADLYTEAVYSVGINSAGTKRAPLTIPAPSPGLFAGDDETSGTLDPDDSALGSFLGNFQSPLFARISDGEQIVSTPPVRASRLRSVSSGRNYS